MLFTDNTKAFVSSNNANCKADDECRWLYLLLASRGLEPLRNCKTITELHFAMYALNLELRNSVVFVFERRFTDASQFTERRQEQIGA